jgi:hypothetical protein
MLDDILICHQQTAWFLLEHKDNEFRGTFKCMRPLEDEDARDKKKPKVGEKKLKVASKDDKKLKVEVDNDRELKVGDKKSKVEVEKDEGTSGGQNSDDGDEDREREDDKGTSTKTCNRAARNSRINKALEGRPIYKALQASIRKAMVYKGDYSLVSPFDKADTWTQNVVDEQLALQLWEKIIDKEEYKRYILYL